MPSPTRRAAGGLVYTKLYEAFFVEIKVALFAAFFISFPIIANQLWAFIAPGLYAREKRAFLPFLIATPVLFTLGASLAYFVVMPTAFKWFLGFEGVSGGLKQEALPAMGDYLDLVMRFILAFGISFLLPVLLMLLNTAGLVSRDQLVGARRYIIVLVFAVAAVITPPDVVSQLLLAVPLLLLFEGSLVLMLFSERKRKAEAEQSKGEEAAKAEAGRRCLIVAVGARFRPSAHKKTGPRGPRSRLQLIGSIRGLVGTSALSLAITIPPTIAASARIARTIPPPPSSSAESDRRTFTSSRNIGGLRENGSDHQAYDAQRRGQFLQTHNNSLPHGLRFAR